MSGEISLNNDVVVTRGTGRYYISKERANNLIMLINSEDCPRMLDIDDNYIASVDIVGIVSASQVEDMEKRRRGLWQCQHGNWQAKEDTNCKCGWGMPNEKQKKQQKEEENRTPEEKERGQLIIKLMRRRIFPKGLGKLSNKDLEKMLE